MENTGKVNFADDKAQWFLSVGEQSVGPIMASDVFRRIESGEFSWGNYIWRQGMSQWERICDVAEFKALMPPRPSAAAANELMQKAKTSPAASPPPPPNQGALRPWYLHYSDAQYGPFSTDEVRSYLVSGRIHSGVHIWKEGMPGWDTVQNLSKSESKFQVGSSSAGGTPSIPQAPKESRKSPRRPFTAKILLASGESVSAAVCRDISIGGMQVLSDSNPGKPGTRIKVNVSPDSSDAQVKPFVAEGVIVRILEDGRGFSYRFDKLSDDAKKAIENYIRSES